jgi:ABC-type glycerol-3-phosphate transport system substrate-binding protein
MLASVSPAIRVYTIKEPLLKGASGMQVVGLPVGALGYHLYYRKDVFAQYNLTLPRTWQELVDYSRAYNGTAGKYAFCGSFSACY